MIKGPMECPHRSFNHFNKQLFYGKNCAEDASSDKRMLAGGGYVACSCTPAKPLWSEVMIFLISSSGREPPHRRKTLPGTPIKQVADIP